MKHLQTAWLFLLFPPLFFLFSLYAGSFLYGEESLTVKSRYISDEEEDLGIVLDLSSLHGGFLVEHQNSDEYRFCGGLASHWVQAGTLSLKGPLQELLSPSSASPVSDVFSTLPRASLLRSWDSSSRVSAAVIVPERAMLSCTVGDTGLPEAGAEFSAEPLPGLSLSAAAAYGTITPADNDDWYLPRGIPPSGEILQTGLRAEAGGEPFTLSVFSAASFHRLLPPGYYLRALVRSSSRYLDTGLRGSWISPEYRTLRRSWPSFHYNGAYEAMLFPAFSVRPFLDLCGELEHAETGLPVEADRSLSGTGGCLFDFRQWKGEIYRTIELEMEEGYWAGDDTLYAEMSFPEIIHVQSLKMKISIQGAWLIAPEAWSGLVDAGAGLELHVKELKCSLYAGQSCDRETGEIPDQREIILQVGAGWNNSDFGINMDLEWIDGICSFSISGAKKFKISQINLSKL